MAHNNGGSGFYLYYTDASTYYGCLAYDNSNGFDYNMASILINCVAHKNAGRNFYFNNYGGTPIMFGCRSTGQVSGDYGFYGNSEKGILISNYFQQNGGVDKANDSLTIDLTIDSVNTNTYLGSDTDYGYNDSANDDFNLITSATMRDVEITLPS